MKCKWCNQELQGNSQYCPYCGQATNNNNQQYKQNNSYQYQNYEQQNKKSEANVWLAILSFFIPLAGLIIFLVKKDNDPQTAKASGICALVSFGLNMLMVILTFSFTIFAAKTTIDTIFDFGQNSINESIDENNDNFQDDFYENDEDIIDEINPNTNVNSKWQNYQITVNNKDITLPTTYNDLKETTGFSMKSSDEKSYLETGYYTILNLYQSDKLASHIEVLNESGADALYTDCKITRISQSEYNVSQGANIIYFPGGLKAGDAINEAKLVELLGDFNDKDEYSSEGYNSVTYKYWENDDWTTTNYYEIRVVNGLIDELTLDHRN